MANLFVEIGIIIILATIFGYIAKLLRQPLIPAYILTGFLIGPILGLVTNSELITTMSEIGIAFFLFVVGLELTFNKIKNVASVSLIGGSLQVITLFLLGMGIALALGFKSLEILYVALIVSFSSTMVVVKLLSDRKELDTLHGRIIVGILLVEDLFAVFALSIMSIISDLSVSIFFIAMFKGIIFISGSMIIILFILPRLFKFAAKSQELFFLLSLSTCFFFSIFALHVGDAIAYILALPILNIISSSTSPIFLTSLKTGFSIAIGSFIAGVGLANLPYHFEIIGRVKSLKDFFATIFYVSLGLALNITFASSVIIPVIVLTFFIIFFKPIIIIVICTFFGYSKKPSFETAVSLTQAGEFGLMIVSQGIILGHIKNDMLVLIVILITITLSLTSYLFQFRNQIYKKFFKNSKLLDRLGPSKNMEYATKKEKATVVVVGYNRIGYSVVKNLKKKRKKFIVVDFNPEAIRSLIDQKIPCIYGDVADIEILERLDFKKIKTLISTISDVDSNIFLVKKYKEHHKKGIAIVTALNIQDGLELYKHGADYVILPHLIGGEHVNVFLEDIATDLDRVFKTKLEHIAELKKRHDLGHSHHINILH
jgi:Kef-type K+ transport system membrane component KefB/Trk K+ transport system NAD-binding subunit